MATQRIRLTGLALVLGLVVATSIVSAHDPDERSALKDQAVAALGLLPGQCMQLLLGYRPIPDLQALEQQAAGLNGPGRVKGVFFGKESELAQDTQGTVVAASDSVVWVLTKDAARDRTVVTEYEEYALPSGRSA